MDICFTVIAVLHLGFQLSCGKSVKYRFIELLVLDYDSFPYLLFLFFWLGVTFPLVALDKTHKGEGKVSKCV